MFHKKIIVVLISVICSGVASAHECAVERLPTMDETFKKISDEKINSSINEQIQSNHAGHVLMVRDVKEVYPVRYYTVMGLQQTTDEHSINIAPAHYDAKFVSGMDNLFRERGLTAINSAEEQEVYPTVFNKPTSAKLVSNQEEVYPVRYYTAMGLQQTTDEHSINIAPAHYDAKFVSGMDNLFRERGLTAINSVEEQLIHPAVFNSAGSVQLVSNQEEVYPVRYYTVMGLQQTTDEHSINIAPAHYDAKFVSGMDNLFRERGLTAINSAEEQEVYPTVFNKPTSAKLVSNQEEVYPVRYYTAMGLQQTTDEHSINIAPAHYDAKFVSGMDKEMSTFANQRIIDSENSLINSQHIQKVLK